MNFPDFSNFECAMVCIKNGLHHAVVNSADVIVYRSLPIVTEEQRHKVKTCSSRDSIIFDPKRD